MFKIKKVRPLFTGVVTTAKRYVGDQFDKTSGGLIIDTRKLDGTLNTLQTVIAVGAMVKDVKEGDIVKLNYNRYAQIHHPKGKIENNIEDDSNMGYSYSIPMIELDGYGQCLFIQNNDIEYVVEEFECDEGGLLQ